MKKGGKVYILDEESGSRLNTTACEEVKCEMLPIYDYVQVRKLFSDLVEQSYVEKSKNLISQIRKVMSQITENSSYSSSAKK